MQDCLLLGWFEMYRLNLRAILFMTFNIPFHLSCVYVYNWQIILLDHVFLQLLTVIILLLDVKGMPLESVWNNFTRSSQVLSSSSLTVTFTVPPFSLFSFSLTRNRKSFIFTFVTLTIHALLAGEITAHSFRKIFKIYAEAFLLQIPYFHAHRFRDQQENSATPKKLIISKM